MCLGQPKPAVRHSFCPAKIVMLMRLRQQLTCSKLLRGMSQYESPGCSIISSQLLPPSSSMHVQAFLTLAKGDEFEIALR